MSSGLPPLRVVFLNRFFHPDHSATSQLLSDLAFALAAGGAQVRVVASRQLYEDAGADLPSRETINEVTVDRVWSTRFGRCSIVGRALDYLTFYFSAAINLLRSMGAGDVIVAKTDPPLLSILAWQVSKLKRAVAVNWLQDIFPEIAVAPGMGARIPRPIVSIMKNLRDRSIRAAHMNVVLGRRMAATVLALNVPPDQIMTIPNWADGATIRPVPADHNKLRWDWTGEGRFIVAYSGNLGRGHDYETIIDAMERIRAVANGPEIAAPTAAKVTFLFIGGGANFERLRDEVIERGLRNVRFVPYQPRDVLAQSLSAGDVHLVSLNPDLEGLMVPSKIYGVAAAGRPAIFIGDRYGEIGAMLEEYGCGWTVSPGQGAELARRILVLAGMPALAQEAGARARAMFERHFDKDIAIGAWSRLLEEAADHGRGITSA